MHGRLTALRELLRTPIGRRLVWTILVEAVIGLGILAATVLLSRKLDTHDRGVAAALLLWPQLLAAVGILGVDLAATHFSADPKRRRDAPATALAVGLPLGIAAGVVYAALIPIIFSGDRLGVFPLVTVALAP